MAQMMGIFLDHAPTTRSVHDNGFGLATVQQGQPGIDIGPHLSQGRLLGIKVKIDCASAVGTCHDSSTYAQGVQLASGDRMSTSLNSSHLCASRIPSSARIILTHTTNTICQHLPTPALIDNVLL